MKEFIALLLCALLTFGGLALGETEAAEESGPVLVEAATRTPLPSRGRRAFGPGARTSTAVGHRHVHGNCF